jgi:glycoside/pentoside/hexuronide:cation symporter, GPH family
MAAMSSFVLKAAGGIGGAIGAFLLAFYKYVPNAETQSAETIQGLYVINFAIPAVLSLLALLIWAYMYPLTKSLTAQMVDDLGSQRKQAL